MENTRDWSGLPFDLLDLIVSKLDSPRDIVSSFLVCKPWRSVGLKTIKRKQIPYLLVPNEDSVDPNAEQRRGLYSVQENRVVHSIRIPHGKRFCGSSYGWLITNDLTGLTLFNPFSGSSIVFPPVARMRLHDGKMCAREEGTAPYPYPSRFRDLFPPSPNTFEHDLDDVEGECEYHFDHRIIKASLSRDPEIYPNDFVLGVVYGVWGRLAFIRPGDEDWTYLPKDKEHFLDVIYFENKFCFVTVNCGLFSCDYKEFPPILERVIPAFNHVGLEGKPYLVESPYGELYLLYRDKDLDSLETVCFHILKFEINDGEAKWVKSLDLGDAAVFLGDNCSLSVLASDFRGCRPNCIYFTDDYHELNFLIGEAPYHWREEEPLEGPTENGFYDVANHKIGKHYQLNPTQKSIPPPIWICLKFK